MSSLHVSKMRHGSRRLPEVSQDVNPISKLDGASRRDARYRHGCDGDEDDEENDCGSNGERDGEDDSATALTEYTR